MNRKMYYYSAVHAVFIIFVTAWILSYPVHAQEKIFLPGILKGNSMAPDPVLRITDGTIIIDLLGFDSGWELANPYWNPQISQFKGGGVFQDSSLSSGRRLVQKEYQNVVETIPLSIRGNNQAQAIGTIRDLLQLGRQSGDFWSESYEFSNVWMEVKPACNDCLTGYSQIITMRIPELTNPFGQPFFSANQVAVMEEITLVIEREPFWRSLAPEQGECTQAKSVQSWTFNGRWLQLEASISSGGNTGDAIYTTAGTALVGVINNPPRFARSTDNGNSWASVNLVGGTPGNTRPDNIVQLPNGHLLATASGIDNTLYRSTDDGASWSSLTNQNILGQSMYVDSSGLIWAGDYGSSIIRSADNGATWASIFTTGEPDGVFGFLEASNGNMFAHVGAAGGGVPPKSIWRSVDNGSNWTKVFTFNETLVGGDPDGFYQMFEGANGRIFATYRTSRLIYSDDFGNSWAQSVSFEDLISTPSWRFTRKGVIYSSGGIIYVIGGTGGTTTTFISSDNGNSWSVDQVFSATSDIVASRLIEADNRLIVGVSGSIWGRNLGDTTDMGRDNTCEAEVYVSNKQNVTNLTTIQSYDDSLTSYTELFPMTSFPVDLFPSIPAAGDILYLGIDTNQINSGLFSSVVFDLADTFKLSSGNLSGFVWEYYDGSVWSTLDVQDNTLAFSVAGVNSVHWQQPSDWATVAINGTTAYWVRARITSSGSPVFTQNPTQQSRNVYAIVNGYIEIEGSNVKGDVPAIARLKIRNTSDLDGPDESGPDLYTQRLLVGLRQYNRGSAFVAFLNVSDEQNPEGVSVSAGTNSAFATDVTTPTSRKIRYTSVSGDPMATRATIKLDSGIAPSFYGIFHAFLRGRFVSGSSIEDVSIRLQFVTGSGGVSFTTPEKEFKAEVSSAVGYAWEVLDFGQVRIPVGNLKNTEVGDIVEIRIQADDPFASNDLVDFYDVVLVPVDEWAVDIVDGAVSSSSYVGIYEDIPRLIDLDSLSDLRNPVRAIIKEANAAERVVSIYNPITAKPVILHAGKQQRLWFLAMRTTDVDSSVYYWLANPEISHSVQVFKNQRYFSLLGTG